MNVAADTFWRRALRQPRQLWLRKALFQVHLWCGLGLALYLTAIALSGSILVFKDELTPRPRVGRLVFDARECTPARLIASMDAAARAHPEMTRSLASCPTEANALYAIVLRPRDAGALASRSLTVYVHPRTGQAVGEVDEGASWIGFVDRFHTDLLLKKNGMIWNGVGAAILLAVVASGLVLWWPGIRHWARGFRVNFGLSWKRITFDLHSAAGIWTLFFTLTWAVTGVYFAWPAPFESAIARISPMTTAQYPQQELNRIMRRASSSGPPTLNLSEVLTTAETVSPGASLEGLFFGSGPNALLTVYMAHGHLGDYARTDFLYFDQQTGKLLYTWHRGRNATLGDWMLWLFVPLHFGTSWGLWGKVTWSAFGLVLPLLVMTGALMYWNRWLRKRLV